LKSHTGPTARARAARLARPTCVERLEGRTLLAAAPGAQLAADINTGTGMTFYSGGVDVNGTLLFRSPDALWRSDGTAAGTVPVRTGLYLEFDSFYGGMFAAGGKAYFLARSDPLEAAPRGLWVSDGTAAGTRMLFSSETLLPAAAAGNSVYFWRWGAEGGLWKSDGTDAGTVRVRDMAANAAAQSMAYNPADGRVYFNAIAAGTGLELWSTDGTDAGTRLVKDINPGPADGSVTNVTASHGKVFFSATPAGSAQAQPFVTDGTAAGTVMLKKIASFTNITPSGYTPAGPNANAAGRTVFTAAGHLYSTDGTPAGTVQLDTNQSPEPRDLTRSGNTVFYSANQRLWATDGTAAGTKMLSNATTGVPSNPLRMVDLNGTLLFRSGSGGAGRAGTSPKCRWIIALASATSKSPATASVALPLA